MQSLVGVPAISWLARIPNISPIKALWDFLGRRVYGGKEYHNEDKLWTEYHVSCRNAFLIKVDAPCTEYPVYLAFGQGYVVKHFSTSIQRFCLSV